MPHSPTKFDARGSYECPYCQALRKTEHLYVIDKDNKVLDIQYVCGTIMKVMFPSGTPSYYNNCGGSTSTNRQIP